MIQATSPKGIKIIFFSNIWPLARPNIAKMGEGYGEKGGAASKWARGDWQTSFGILNFWANPFFNDLGLLFMIFYVEPRPPNPLQPISRPCHIEKYLSSRMAFFCVRSGTLLGRCRYRASQKNRNPKCTNWTSLESKSCLETHTQPLPQRPSELCKMQHNTFLEEEILVLLFSFWF